MMLDTASLRVAFGIVALTMLILFYGATYRSARSPYCGWWCTALALYLSGSTAFLFDGTAQQYWANPVGNCLLVLGGAATWTAARTLRGSRPTIWQLALAPILTLILSSLDNPGTNVWSGGYIFLLAMSATIGLSAFELWRMERTHTQVQVMLAVVAGLTSCYYFVRWVVYLVEGPNGEVFTTYFGSATTTLLNLVLLAVVSYSMSELSHEQSTRELTTRATRDGLTGLLNRTEFLRLAGIHAQKMKRSPNGAALILADLDHFKDINDSYGHAAGDQVLREFAAACLDTVRSTDMVGRYGGEEFILLLPGTTRDHAEKIAEEISQRLGGMAEIVGGYSPTVSYGLGSTSFGTPLEETIASVDAALYQAKQLGRNRVERVVEVDAVVESVRDGEAAVREARKAR